MLHFIANIQAVSWYGVTLKSRKMRRLFQFSFKHKHIVHEEDNNDEYICTTL